MESSTQNAKKDLPEEFKKIISEFTQALLEVCPEYNNGNLNNDLKSIILGEATIENIETLYTYCSNVYPANIFSIMGKSDEMFENNECNTEFLPGIEFKNIWKDESITSSTRETIWKYVQLILFTIVGNISDMESFGDSAKLFEMIDEDELKDKLQETFENMEQMFTEAETHEQSGDNDKDSTHSNDNGEPSFNMPDVNNIHDHLKGLMGGKLGNLAAEIAEETAQELNINENDHGSVKDVFQSMMKNPTKLMGIANKIGNKLEDKMKSGELNEKELMKEAADMFSKMKNTPGMGDIEKMMRSMGGMGGMGGMGKKAKVDMNAMQQYFDRQASVVKMKERAERSANMRREKLQKEEEHRKWLAQQPDTVDPQLLRDLGMTEEEIFSYGEKPQRTPRPQSGAQKSGAQKSGGKKKKKKGKK